MINAYDTLRDFLVAQSNITTLTSTRIWAEMDTPPGSYKPSDGAAIVFKMRPGIGPDSSNSILHSSFQFKFYGPTIDVAWAVCRATSDRLFDASLFGASFQSAIEIDGQSVPEPQTDWPVVLAFYETWMRSGLPVYSPT